MNFARAYNFIIATLLIIIYLTLPATSLAYAATLEGSVPSVQMFSDTTTAAPCGTCPCPDDQGSGCCETTGCNCECHAPLGRGLRISYAPVIATQSFREPSWSLSQVFRPIFVPPQNPA